MPAVAACMDVSLCARLEAATLACGPASTGMLPAVKELVGNLNDVGPWPSKQQPSTLTSGPSIQLLDEQSAAQFVLSGDGKAFPASPGRSRFGRCPRLPARLRSLQSHGVNPNRVRPPGADSTSKTSWDGDGWSACRGKIGRTHPPLVSGVVGGVEGQSWKAQAMGRRRLWARTAKSVQSEVDSGDSLLLGDTAGWRHSRPEAGRGGESATCSPGAAGFPSTVDDPKALTLGLFDDRHLQRSGSDDQD